MADSGPDETQLMSLVVADREKQILLTDLDKKLRDPLLSVK
jgi:hypothetical protein